MSEGEKAGKTPRKPRKTRGKQAHFRLLMPAKAKDQINRDAHAIGMNFEDYLVKICTERSETIALTEDNLRQVEHYAEKEGLTRDDVVNRMLQQLRAMIANPRLIG